MRIDGMLRKIPTIPKNLQNFCYFRIQVHGGMDIAERRIPQDGRFNVKAIKRIRSAYLVASDWSMEKRS